MWMQQRTEIRFKLTSLFKKFFVKNKHISFALSRMKAPFSQFFESFAQIAYIQYV